MGPKMKLLVGGKEAFPVILEEIRAAQRSIYINMFIWRDDNIGNTIAAELLKAADRGVMIEIVKDRYGILCEYSEEDQSSFFHKKVSLKERTEIFFMKFSYQRELLFKPFSMGDGKLLRSMHEHPNITIKDKEYRRDHSKFYIFDEKTIILGGINVEDKENGVDIQGRYYVDYMVRMEGADAVGELRRTLTGDAGNGRGLFGMNLPGDSRNFDIRRRYLELFDEAEKELSIVMAYMMPFDDMVKALERAIDRGVKLRLLIPEKANYMNDSNRAFATSLYDHACKNGGKLEIYLSKKMTHIKAMVSDNTISIGSANMTGKAFVQLGELNAFVPNDGEEFSRSVKESFRALFEEAQPVSDRAQLRYSKLMRLLEKLVMSR